MGGLADHDDHPGLPDPAGEEEEEAQGGVVGVPCLVDEDHHRSALAQGQDRLVQAVQDLELHVGRAGGAGGAGQPGAFLADQGLRIVHGAGEFGALEELAGHTQRDARLRRGGDGVEQDGTGLVGAVHTCLRQRGVPAARGPPTTTTEPCPSLARSRASLSVFVSTAFSE